MKNAVVTLSVTFVLFAAANSAGAAVIVSTDFTGRTVPAPPGLTVTDITWTTLGVNNPGDLTAINEAPGALPGIFDTVNAQGYFAPDKNVDNEGPWSVDVPLVIASGYASVTLDDVELDWAAFTNGGAFQAAARSSVWTVEVIGSSSGILDTLSANVNAITGVETLTFAPSLVLPSTETYTLNIRSSTAGGPGNNTGLDGITVNGSATLAPTPEPSTVALAAVGLILLCVTRRRR